MAGPVASLGEAGRRAIPRLTTQGQARLSPAACMLAVCLLPPSGHSVHWALRLEGQANMVSSIKRGYKTKIRVR